MKRYDPLTPPDAEKWHRLGRKKRTDLVLQHHRQAKIPLPDAKLHAIFHTIIETQITDEERARQAMVRLQAEGLDRHEAIHALGSVLARHMYALLKSRNPEAGAWDSYWEDIERLKASEWLRESEQE